MNAGWFASWEQPAPQTQKSVAPPPPPEPLVKDTVTSETLESKISVTATNVGGTTTQRRRSSRLKNKQ